MEELFPGPPRTFLYICARRAGLALDLRIIQTLLRLGHKVILTLKEAPVYYAPTVWDVDRDPLLVDNLPESHIFKAPAASKNELLRRLRENRLLIISDGTGERLNLYRTSVTFARAWKESDAIIARGRCNRDVLLGTSHLFTRDVFCFWKDRGEVRMQLKPHAPGIRKFSEQALTAKAGHHQEYACLQGQRQGRDVLQLHHRQHPRPDRHGDQGGGHVRPVAAGAA